MHPSRFYSRYYHVALYVAARSAIRVRRRTTVRELTLDARLSPLTVSRMFTVIICSNDPESTFPAGAVIQTCRSLRTFPFISRRLNRTTCPVKNSTRRSKSMPRRSRRRNAHGCRRREIPAALSPSGSEVDEIELPDEWRWCCAALWKRRPALSAGLLIIIKWTVPAHMTAHE